MNLDPRPRPFPFWPAWLINLGALCICAPTDYIDIVTGQMKNPYSIPLQLAAIVGGNLVGISAWHLNNRFRMWRWRQQQTREIRDAR